MKTNYSIMRRISAVLVILLVFCGVSFSPQNSDAQPGHYALASYSSGNPNTASNGAYIGGMQAGNYAGQGSNWRSAQSFVGVVLAVLPINFNFHFKSGSNSYAPTSYQNAYVYSNGLITLNGTSGQPQVNNVGQNASVPHFGIFWQNGGSTGGGVYWRGCQQEILRYETVGSAPNRVFVINFYQWTLRQYPRGAGGGPQQRGENRGSMQFRLYEQGQVEYYYDFMSTHSNCENIVDNSTKAAIGMGLGSSSEISVQPNGNSAPSVSKAIYYQNIDITNSPIPATTLYVFDVPPNRQLTTSPKILNYGTQIAGTSTTLFAIACNTADAVAPLIINSATISQSNDYKITQMPANLTLNPGQCDTFGITFSPTFGGTRNGIFTINSTGNDSGSQSIVLTGQSLVAEYTYDSSFLFRNTKTKLGDTLIQCIHIVGTGQSPAVFTGASFLGIDANQYQVIRLPGVIPPPPASNPVPNGSRDSICIAYIPTIEGAHRSTVVINSNSLDHPQLQIPLFGYGILPHIIVTPPSLLLFDSTAEGDTVCKDLTIFNPGSDTLRLLANFLSSSEGDFIYPTLMNGLQNIAPDQTRTLSICFHPLQAGTREGRITLRTNIPLTFETPRRDTASTYVIELRGTGLPLGVLSNKIVGPLILDSIPVGQSVCRIDSLCNTGDADITVTSVTFSDPEFAEGTRKLPAVPFVLKARSCVVFDLCGTPTQQGLRTGTLTINGTSNTRTRTTGAILLAVYGLNLCASPTPAALFLGTKVPKDSTATQCDTITNCGEVAAVYTASLSGADKADYTITSPNPSPSIPPGGTYAFCIDFKVSTETTTTASLDVATPDVTTLHIPLTAAGVCATLTHDVPSVPPTAASASNTFTFTITNTGSGDWTPGTPTITGANAGDYTLVSIVPNPIPAGKTGTVTMKFSPPLGSAGTSRIANISWPNGGPCQNATVSVDLASPTVAGVTTNIEQDGFNLDQTYPNPTQGKATFTYTTPREAEIKISLVDMTGKILETLVSGNVSPGEYTVSFDASKYPSGTYIYMLESGSVKLVRQLILTK